MSVVLVNGDGNPAVYASQDADLLGGIGGQETGILDINDKFAATIADANTVEISSGVCITKEGRRIQIDVGDVEEIVVPTGSQGTTKYYIIGFHLYTDGSGNQLAETFIDEVASPSATITEKMFKDGETEVYVSLYRITRNGLNLEGLTLILPEIGSLAGGGIIGDTDISGIGDGTVTGAIAQINTDLSALGDYTVNTEEIIGVLKPSNKTLYRRLYYVPTANLTGEYVVDSTLKYSDITGVIKANGSYKGGASSYEVLPFAYGSGQRVIYINNNGVCVASASFSGTVTELYLEIVYTKD